MFAQRFPFVLVFKASESWTFYLAPNLLNTAMLG